MAEGDAGGVGFVGGEGAAVAEEAHHGAGHLLFARAAGADDGLFHAERGIFENRFFVKGGGRDGGSACGAEDLGGLEVLHVDRLFEGDVADVVAGDEGGDGAVDFGEGLGHGALGGDVHGQAAEEDGLAAGGELNEGQAGAAETGVDAEDTAGEWGAGEREGGGGFEREVFEGRGGRERRSGGGGDFAGEFGGPELADVLARHLKAKEEL